MLEKEVAQDYVRKCYEFGPGDFPRLSRKIQ